MKIQQIRNATLILEFGGKRFLIDPFFADKDAFPAIPFTANDKSNPLVSLPVSIEELVKVDVVVITHLHVDHFDEAAKEALPKTIKIFAQDEEEAEVLRSYGFQDVEALQEEGSSFEGIQLTKTKAEHGREEALGYMRKFGFTDQASGVVFKHESEKTLYLAGDTIWCDAVQEALDTHAPEIIILNGGDAQFLEGGSIIMGKEDIYEVYQAAPQARIVVSHMEAVNHALLSRNELSEFINEKEMSSRVFVPADGESFTF